MISTNINSKTGISSKTGVLFSGGLDSSILTSHLLEAGCQVQPLYIRSGLRWEEAELAAAREYLGAVRCTALSELAILDVPVTDLYGQHWSLSNARAPDAESADVEVYLPGRNALLVVKTAVWCKLNNVPRLALATLGTSPFADASEKFFGLLQAALDCGWEQPMPISQPFARCDKQAVMNLGRGFPLGLTFSCIAPVGRHQCGSCNKCGERQAAFGSIQLPDPTAYLHDSLATIPALESR